MGRYNPKGVEKWIFFSSANEPSSLAAITQLEFSTDGIDMGGVENAESMYQHNGWTSSPSVNNAPDILNTETGNTPGDTTRGVGTLQYYSDQTPADNLIKIAFPKATAGFIVKCPMGTAAGAYTEAIPCTVIANEFDDGNNAQQMHTISFSQGTMTPGVAAA